MADVTLTHPDHDGRIVLDDVADAGRIRILSRQDWVTGTAAPIYTDGEVVDNLDALEG